MVRDGSPDPSVINNEKDIEGGKRLSVGLIDRVLKGAQKCSSCDLIVPRPPLPHLPQNTPPLSFSSHFFVFIFLFRTTPTGHGSSHARDRIGAIAAGLRHSNWGSEPCLQPTPELTGDTRSLTHRARPGIEPTTSWFLVRFISPALLQELPWLSLSIRAFLSPASLPQ